MQNNASPSGEKILENNETIALFMGWTKKPSEYGDEYHSPDVNGFCYKDMFHFHDSWSCLKPVVDKIFTYSLAHKDQTERLRKTSIVVDIMPCWQICVDFITWYNQQTPSNEQ